MSVSLVLADTKEPRHAQRRRLPRPAPLWRSQRGGWNYEAGDLCTVPELTAFGTTFPIGHEDRVGMAAEVQGRLDRDWSVGDHPRPLSNVLSAGRYVAQIHDG